MDDEEQEIPSFYRKMKYYRLYQSTDKETWNGIYSGSEIGTAVSISETYGPDKQGSTYIIPYTGYYTLTASGAKGADYSEMFTGGNGGSVTAAYWLKQGDVLTLYPGTAGDGQTGGTNGNGADGGTSSSDTGRGGGAATQIFLTRNGSSVELLTAGGGGGANAGYTGGDGGTGGSEGTVMNGEDGVGAGGGGHAGGTAAVVLHEHVESCYHTHTGSSSEYGGCYVIETKGTTRCGTAKQNTNGYYHCVTCMADWGEASHSYYATVHEGHYYEHHNPTYVCSGCGKSLSKGQVHNKSYTYYELGCTYKDYESGDVVCGKEESYGTSGGGGNYIAAGYGCKNPISTAGVNGNDGSVTITSGQIGFTEENRLDDVLARDMAAPGNISEYSGKLAGETTYRVSVTDPKDYGTVYYHKAESYPEGSTEILALSNVTENTLTSGIYGYRYYVDSYENGTVDEGHTMTTERGIDVNMAAGEQYLHVAAVDVAGNIGPTADIRIPPKEEAPDQEIEDEYMEEVPLRTEKIRLQASDYVHEAAVGTYYVRADGSTPHKISVTGYVDGNATNDYQVDILRVVSEADGTKEWFQNRIPRLDIHAGDKEFVNEALVTGASDGELSYLLPASAEASRTDQAAKVTLLQQFEIDTVNDGKQIFVYPKAKAEFENGEYFSDEAEDRNNGITLIPDGTPPAIYGLDELEAAGNLDMTEGESKTFIISAADSGSGLRSLTVTITNQDNQLTETFTATDNSLTITVNPSDYLYTGDFIVSAEAVDNVGNRNVAGEETNAFTLEANLKRAREPHDGDFKAGDGGVITVTTGGYADKIIIRFPEELAALKPDLDHEYVYEWPTAVKTEVYEFNLPLGTPAGSYLIEIEAWKNGRKLTKELQLPVRTNGSIIDELRTRIRDNGV